MSPVATLGDEFVGNCLFPDSAMSGGKLGFTERMCACVRDTGVSMCYDLSWEGESEGLQSHRSFPLGFRFSRDWVSALSADSEAAAVQCSN